MSKMAIPVFLSQSEPDLPDNFVEPLHYPEDPETRSKRRQPCTWEDNEVIQISGSFLNCFRELT
jgi:hypothetical protein